MKNPFPGMNPYLQERWGDFHTSFTVALRDALNQSLPGDLEARVEESITVDIEEWQFFDFRIPSGSCQ